MARHISSDEVARLRTGTLAPEEAVRVLEHRAVCDECRALGAASGDATALRALLEGDGCPARSPEGEQQLIEFALGRLEPSAAAEISEHVQSCSRCTEILAELREDRVALTPPPALPSRWRRVAIAAALVLALAGAAWRLLRQQTPVDRIQDGGALLALSRSGEWRGVALADAADRDLVLAALRSRHLPAAVQELPVPETGVFRGAAAKAGFELLAPVYTRVESVRPQFHWSPLPNATSYRVAVFSMDMQVREVSPALRPTETSWAPTKDLARGARVGWQVTAERRGADPVLAPMPPAPPVYFEVVGEAAEQRIAKARAAYPPAHLLLAALYAQEGMRAEARAETEALAQANPGSAVARALADSTQK